MAKYNMKGDVEGLEVPKNFYNIQSVLDLPPPQGENVRLLPKIFPKELLREEMSKEKHIPIPSEVAEALAQYRPSPLVRAARLERYLKLRTA